MDLGLDTSGLFRELLCKVGLELIPLLTAAVPGVPLTGTDGSLLLPLSLSVAVKFLVGSCGTFRVNCGLCVAAFLTVVLGLGLPGGVGAAGLTPLGCLAAIPGICGSDLPGDDLAAAEGVVFVGEGGLDNLDGTTGLGLPGT